MNMHLRRFLSDQSAVTGIEYALLGSLISVAIVIGASAAGTQLQQLWEYIRNRVVAGTS